MTYADAPHPCCVSPSAPVPSSAPAEPAADLAAAIAAMHFSFDPLAMLEEEPSGRAGSPTRRRARSLSPQRRSPKLRHTNGRLHDEPIDSTEAVGGCELLSEEELLHVIRMQARTQKSTGSIPSARAARRRYDSLSFPSRKDVRRSLSCVDWDDAHPIAEEGVPLGDTSPTASTAGTGTNKQPARTPTPRRIKIFYRDEAVRESWTKNTRRMIEHVRSGRQPSSPPADALVTTPSEVPSPGPSNQQRLAWKALRYRKLLDRMDEIDASRLEDPSFDVLECLGVQWCKV